MIWLRRAWSFLLGFTGAIAVGAAVATFMVNRQLETVGSGRQPAAQEMGLEKMNAIEKRDQAFCVRFSSPAARELCQKSDPAGNAR